jgi:hypothetical protein
MVVEVKVKHFIRHNTSAWVAQQVFDLRWARDDDWIFLLSGLCNVSKRQPDSKELCHNSAAFLSSLPLQF